MQIYFLLFIPFVYLFFLVEFIISLFIDVDINGYFLGHSSFLGFYRPILYPIDLRPQYQCSKLAGWSCYDASNFPFWIVILVMIFGVSTYILFKKKRNKKHILIIWYLSAWIGILIYIFLIKLIFPEPKPF